VRLGEQAGRGKRESGRHRSWQVRAFVTAAALTAVIFTAGCAGLGTSGGLGTSAAGGQAAAAALSTASKASGSASATATHHATKRPLPHPHSAAATRTRTPAGAPGAGSHSAPAGPAAADPPPAAAAVQPSGNRRLVTFVNDVSQTIWVAADPSATSPLSATGWVLPPGHSVTITTPNNLNTRFWGRTGCVFNSAGTGHCQTGDCGGRFQCKSWGAIPATLAEVNFDAWDSLDFYDVSMVDGSNLPMWINITKSSGGTKDRISSNGCVAAGCTKPVNCPSVLDVKVGGVVVGCISACARLGGNQYCCGGPGACNPAKWPVDYAAVFKKAEPYAYSYSSDDATSVFTCKGVCDYRITFGLSKT
jgi:Thaumatin family